jgi:hypothetical protein
LDAISAEQLDMLPSNDNAAIEILPSNDNAAIEMLPSNSLPQSGESMDVEYDVCQVRNIYIELFPT